MSLMEHEIAAYERDGFLVLEDFATAAEIAVLRKRVNEIVDRTDPGESLSIFTTRDQAARTDAYFLGSGGAIRLFLEEDAVDAQGRLTRPLPLCVNKIGHALHDLDPVFERFSYSAYVADLLAALGFRDPRLLQSMYIFKQPHIGGEVNVHQDATFLYTEPLTTVGLWLALDDADRDNGCLWALPGGHREPPRQRFVRVSPGEARMDTLDPTPWPVERMVPFEVPAGTMIVLHGLLPHMSYPNRSPRTRHAYTLHAIEGWAHYPAENWLQRGLDMPLRILGPTADQWPESE